MKLTRKKVLSILGMILVGVFISFLFATMSLQHSVALEQKLRCGIQEHSHIDQCYDGDFLVCEQMDHSHDGNCYIVLLQENNINQLLTLMKEAGTNSLEYVINNVVSDALVKNQNMLSITIVDGKTQEIIRHDETEEDSLTQEKVAKMNQTISKREEIPTLVLNEKLNNEIDVREEKQKEIVDTGTIEGTHEQPSLVGVNDPLNKNNYYANFFVYLDGKWTRIGNLQFTTERTSGSSNRYNGVIQTNELLSLVNSSLGTEYVYNSFDIAVATSENGTYSKNNVAVASVTTTVAYNQSNNEVRRARYIRLIPEGGAAGSTEFAFHTVKFEYPDGTVSEARYVRKGSNIILPAGNYEWTAEGKTYAAGQSVTINKATTFKGTMVGPVTYVNVNYNVNFTDVSGVTVSTKPTIAGLTTTSVNDGYTEGSSATIRNVSQQTVQGSVNGNNTGLSRVVQFKGWKVGNTDVILQPNTTLIWEELVQYSTGGTIKLTAVWESEAVRTASFFIRFDSVAVDTEGNVTGQDSNLYTKELFAAYVGGVDPSLGDSTLNTRYNIADTTADNSYGADQEIRALYGEKTEGVWLSALPKDDDIFASLVQYANTGYLSVDGDPVKAEDLNDREYAIRWYVFKCQSDAWHIDGKLVKKEGLIHVYKTFAGNKELINRSKSNFYIDAYDIKDNAHTYLSMNNFKNYDASTDTYMWEISNIDYGEEWLLTEHPEISDTNGEKHTIYSEYSVVDAIGDQSTTGVGSSFVVEGMTYALDEGIDEVLRASFTNIYNRANAIVIKKQDSLTGNSIGGATFELLQNGEVLRFYYNQETNSYEYAPEAGNVTVLEGSANGYFEIFIEDFTYDDGPIVVREKTAPVGYTPIGDIQIGYMDDNENIGILSGNSDLIQYIDGILIIGNSTDATYVTVQKKWECPEIEWQDAKIQLLANGKLATTVIAGVVPEIILNSQNNWTHTWENLPVYVNGEKIQWTVRETQVGSEQCKADGSFVNWIVSYGLPVVSKDSEGNEHVLLTVVNTTKRVMLRLTKTDMNESQLLAGATFLLEAVDVGGNVLANEVAKTATTGADGTLIFDNLKSNVRYRLTEMNPPIGFLNIDGYIYFIINEDGSVTVEENFFAETGDTAYNIIVKNAAGVTLPETGGDGNFILYAISFMLMAGAGCIYAGTILRRRCHS